MSMAPYLLIIFLSILMVMTPNKASRPFERISNGWEPVGNLKDPRVVEIATFAVAEHNKETNKNLNFVNIVSGEQQMVAGTIYRLDISLKDGADDYTACPKIYRVDIWSKPWEKFLKLESFEEINDQGGYETYAPTYSP
ncbi:hypothetical protein OROMI_022237 [Orobanche minor]